MDGPAAGAGAPEASSTGRAYSTSRPSVPAVGGHRRRQGTVARAPRLIEVPRLTSCGARRPGRPLVRRRGRAAPGHLIASSITPSGAHTTHCPIPAAAHPPCARTLPYVIIVKSARRSCARTPRLGPPNGPRLPGLPSDRSRITAASVPTPGRGDTPTTSRFYCRSTSSTTARHDALDTETLFDRRTGGPAAGLPRLVTPAPWAPHDSGIAAADLLLLRGFERHRATRGNVRAHGPGSPTRRPATWQFPGCAGGPWLLRVRRVDQSGVAAHRPSAGRRHRRFVRS